VMPATAASPEDLLTLALRAEVGPLAEAMYIMMSSDGHVSEEERSVLKGAIRSLAGDTVRTAHVDALLADAIKNVEASGRSVRLTEVAKLLSQETERAEVAFVLAAAVAFADSAIADEENETLNQFAEALGIDETRANALLDELEHGAEQGIRE
jgi:tellurite resistance protein